MKKRIILFLVVSLLLIICAIAFYIFSQPPKEKLSEEFKEEAVTKLLGRKAQIADKNIPTGDTEFKGKYITFKYPARALIYEFRENSTTSGSATLEDFSFDLKDPTITFNMQVVKNSANLNSVIDIPSVRLRVLRDYEYDKSEVTAGKVKGTAFQKNENGIEKSAFFLHNGNIYTISITGVEQSSVITLFENVLSTVSFVDGDNSGL